MDDQYYLYIIMGIFLLIFIVVLCSSGSASSSDSSSDSSADSSADPSPCDFCKHYKDANILAYVEKENLNQERRLAAYCPVCGKKLVREEKTEK